MNAEDLADLLLVVIVMGLFALAGVLIVVAIATP